MPTQSNPEPRYLNFAVVAWSEQLGTWSGHHSLTGAAEIRSHQLSIDSQGSQLAVFRSLIDASYETQPILERALEFDAVLQQLHAAHDIIPMRFQEPSVDRLFVTWYKSQGHTLGNALKRLQGTSQINVRWMLPCAAPQASRTTEATATKQVSGTDYLRARSRATSGERSLHAELSDLVAQLHVALPGLRSKPLPNVRTLPDQGIQLAGIDLLVERKQVTQVQSYLRQLKLRNQLPALVTNALPAFSFVEEELSFANIACQSSRELQVQTSAKELAASTSSQS